MKLTNAIVATAVAVGGFTAASNAGSVTATFDGVSPREIVYVGAWQDGSKIFKGGAYAGIMNWKNATAGGPTFEAFCIELDQHINNGRTVTFEEYDLPGNETRTLTSAIAASLETFWGINYGYMTTLGNMSAAAAAFQLGVWELVYDNADRNVWNVGTAGTGFKVTSNTNTQAEEWAQDMLNRMNTHTGHQDLFALTNPDYQDQLRIAHTPTPSAAAAGLVGLGVLGLRRRRARA